MAVNPSERNQDATVYIGNLDERVTDTIVWELMLQAGPVVNVHLPRDRITGNHQGYGFCEFMTEEDADYAMKIMNMIKLYGKPIRVNKASMDRKNMDIGANLFIGNLDPDVDEKLLYDTFSAFGIIIQTPKIGRDMAGNSKGYGFLSYDTFEASDAAIEAMNGQFLCNKQITVSYAFKKDGKGERHGSHAERVLAAQSRLNQTNVAPNRLFGEVPGAGPVPVAIPPPSTPSLPLPLPPPTSANAPQMYRPPPPPMHSMPPRPGPPPPFPPMGLPLAPPMGHPMGMPFRPPFRS